MITLGPPAVPRPPLLLAALALATVLARRLAPPVRAAAVGTRLRLAAGIGPRATTGGAARAGR
jgi:hypothetical protein